VYIRYLYSLLVLVSVYSFLYAKGTAVGTVVSGNAQIVYAVEGMEYNSTSNDDTFIVDRVVDVDVVWEDSKAIEVASNEKRRILTFLLTNRGNGDDNISLEIEHNSSSQFLPENMQLFYDTNRNGYFDLPDDKTITDVNLSADANITLFIVADIPDGNFTGGEKAEEFLVATSEYNVSSPNEDIQAEIDIVLRQEKDRASGSYVVRDYWLESVKSAIVDSEDNATHTGTKITYTIDLFIGGKSEGKKIENIVLIDAIPESTQYVLGSLRLNDTSLSDKNDSDAGMYSERSIEVAVPKIEDSEHHRIFFDVVVE